MKYDIMLHFGKYWEFHSYSILTICHKCAMDLDEQDPDAEQIQQYFFLNMRKQ